MESSSKVVTITMDPNTDIYSDVGAMSETDTDTKYDEVVDSDNPFSTGEKVLAYHTSCLYPAKIQEVQLQNGTCGYYIHYLGWKKSWDEWVGADCLLKLTDENIQKQKELNAKHSGERMPGRASVIRHMNPSVAKGRKRKNDSTAKEKNDCDLESLVQYHIPSALKKQLVDDCESITNMGKLVKLPRKPNVDDILKKYLSYRSKKDGKVADMDDEILSGLCCYFDKSLSAMLLYKSERKQYQEAIVDSASPATLYGAEHLLRLFVKLPEILYAANIEEDTLKELQQKLQDILRFLQRNQSTFFTSSYQKQEDFESSPEEVD